MNKKPPKIEFPCKHYPVKVLGVASEPVKDFILSTTERYAPGFDRSKIKVNASSGGRFQSITVFITATGSEQLHDYHQALIAHEEIKVVL